MSEFYEKKMLLLDLRATSKKVVVLGVVCTTKSRTLRQLWSNYNFLAVVVKLQLFVSKSESLEK